MRHAVFLLCLSVALVFGAAARAQDQVWVQIEAQPTLRQAEERARAYTGVFPDVAGFQLTSGWYAIVLGPYAADMAAARLGALRNERLIPGDSFLADGRNFRSQFWPVGQGALPPEVAAQPLPDPVAESVADPLMQPPPAPEVLAAPEPESEPATLPEETPAEARRVEAALNRDDRLALQTALQWFGHYRSAIDGAFGPGTRNAMAAWQEANALPPTGILTTAQRALLLDAYGQAQAELGLATVTEPEAGIEITLPLALVAFDHYEPPFVHFAEKGGSGVRVILISQPGDQGTLYGLYDILQTLEAVPLDGPRERGERSFTISGRSATLESHTYAELSQGLVKGYMLVWNPADGERMARVLAAMQASFRPVGERALDPGLVPMAAEQRKGLLSGLEVRRPLRSRSGFYVDTSGAVLTTTEATTGCARITIDRDQEADLVLSDPALGIALLRPRVALAPAAVAQVQTGALRLGAEVAVSGYSYEDLLPSPTLTFGTLEDDKGLNGESGLVRLTLEALPGDAGGPVIDAAGGVLGMLLPRADGGTRQLPAEVAFAVSGTGLAAKLAGAGIMVPVSTRQGALAPEDLGRLATGMTALVSCWN
ncbi:peptidoglycan-binding protein [Paracoccaceae bacterium Fryx2]|nr:peptidoglycan-binding protein [Paracoccaceae bacterium Fryx2]